MGGRAADPGSEARSEWEDRVATTNPSGIESVEETERKYTADTDLTLPDLSGLPGVETLTDERIELAAQYYDTRDLRLLRAGITLRRREGGDDAGWHLKLPSGLDTRTELRFPLGDDTGTPPAELLGLLRGVRRDRPVELAALLTTSRRRIRAMGPGETVLAEIVVDDVVAVRGADDAQVQWREIEVELGRNGAAQGGASLLDAVDDRLTAEGIERSPSPSKLHRVLGDLIPDEPKVGGPAGYLRDYLATELRELELTDIAVRRAAPDSVHSMRKAARRARSALQTYAGDLGLDESVVDELRWLGRRLSPSRDLEVQWERLLDRVAEIPVESHREPAKARIDEYFSRQSEIAGIEAVAALDSDRYLQMLLALDALIEGLATAPQTSRKVRKAKAGDLTGSLEQLAQKVSKRVRAVGRADTPEERDARMHRARKGAKRMRYAIEVIRPLHPKRAGKALDHFDAFQDLLGEFQDSVVAREHLLDIVSEQGHAAESSFGLGIAYHREALLGEAQAVHLDDAWKEALRAAKPLWK
ncbi:CYTH and CHAD domain-containing protein [Rhodococcus sp. HM1]|uniref:CYTH and CHAD domain-containing protein n=1 Tax=Rhodococcus sp. HM1 TaxID=2937759 RepID=UPI00200B5458|nr:CYTH and CHAD domain-containing protein [Rhodococcus sp. HM1]MCK8670638.1 CYTH and CHAD domain-containing protein [Rhodococcus sp. HM1]